MKKIGLSLLLLISTAQARPNPERLGICYGFRGDQLFLHAPCIISTGSGTGAQYTTLTVDKTQFYIEYRNDKPNLPPTVNGKPAISYQRDASFYQVLKGPPIKEDAYMDCTRTLDKKIDICSFDPDSQ